MARGRRPGAVRDYLDAVRAADLVLVSGGGFLNDVFRRYALIVLDTLEMAIESGAVTALLGQDSVRSLTAICGAESQKYCHALASSPCAKE